MYSLIKSWRFRDQIKRLIHGVLSTKASRCLQAYFILSSSCQIRFKIFPHCRHHAGIPIFVLKEHYLCTIRDLLKLFSKCRPCPPFIKKIHCCNLFRPFQRKPYCNRIFHIQICIFSTWFIFYIQRKLSDPAVSFFLFQHLYLKAIF